MPREKRYSSRAEQQRAYRERKALLEQSDVPEQVSDPALEALVGQEVLSEAQEQAIRDSWGYSASETRTKAERDAAAKRMVEKARARA
jgi:hypothetical protein